MVNVRKREDNNEKGKNKRTPPVCISNQIGLNNIGFQGKEMLLVDISNND